MARVSARRLSQFAIGALFLGLVRTLGEIYRLRYVEGPSLGLDDVMPYVAGALMAAVGVWAAVIAYFLDRHRLATGIVGVTIALMIVYKITIIG